MKYSFFVFLSAIALFVLGCSTEFNPNTDWQETMVVYGLIDQEDDNSYIRIQKTFLGEGNMNDFAQVLDSNCYADGVLTVQLSEWTYSKNGNQLLPQNSTGKVITFQREMLNNKPNGEFFHPNQPIYLAATKGQFLNDKMYRLEITNNNSGEKVSADAYMIPNGVKLTSPYYLAFNESYTTKNPYMKVEWTTGESSQIARIYQSFMRFYYYEAIPGQTGEYSLKYLDIDIGLKRNPNNEAKLSINFMQSSFTSALTSAFFGQENIDKVFADSADIYVTSGSEDLSNYMDASSPSLTLVQERPIYSNVENGLGIFTSRRKHYKVRFLVDRSIKKVVTNLNVGF